MGNARDNQKAHTAAFTGHRELRLGDPVRLKQRLSELLPQLIEHDSYRFFGSGGARGFDLLAAQAVLDLKYRYPHIKLIMVLPCRNQTERWNDADKQVYETVLSRADKITFTSDGKYTKNCMRIRNQHLVDCSSLVIAYQFRTASGSLQTVNYANMRGVKVLNLA